MATVLKIVQRPYLPAAGSDRALPFYDPLVKLLGADKARAVLIDQAALQPGNRVLDIGCGTGTLAAQLKRSFPSIDVTGLDPDPLALNRARQKASRNGVTVQFDQGYADELPYPDSSYDRVFSSFMFHHLPAKARENALREVRRVLKPGGSLHLLDFSTSHSHGLLAHLFHAREKLKDNSDERLIDEKRWVRAGEPNRRRLTLCGHFPYRVLPSHKNLDRRYLSPELLIRMSTTRRRKKQFFVIAWRIFAHPK